MRRPAADPFPRRLSRFLSRTGLRTPSGTPFRSGATATRSPRSRGQSRKPRTACLKRSDLKSTVGSRRISGRFSPHSERNSIPENRYPASQIKTGTRCHASPGKNSFSGSDYVSPLTARYRRRFITAVPVFRYLIRSCGRYRRARGQTSPCRRSSRDPSSAHRSRQRHRRSCVSRTGIRRSPCRRRVQTRGSR